jgi:hypothetical protein
LNGVAKWAGAFAGAALTVAVGTAVTAGQGIPANSFVGYGEGRASGVTVTDVSYAYGADGQIVKAVFETSDDLTALKKAPNVSSTLAATDDTVLARDASCDVAATSFTCSYVPESGQAAGAQTVGKYTLQVA